MKNKLLIIFSLLFIITIKIQAQTSCKAIAQFSTYACNQITEEMCYASGNPAACAVAVILAWDASDWGNNVIERGFNAGCNYTVTRTTQGYQVIVEGSKSAVDGFLYEFKRYVLKDNWSYYTGY